MEQISVRVAAPLHKILQAEADRRAEDLATTVRRHLVESCRQSESNLRLERLERKLDALAGATAGGAVGTPGGLADAVEAMGNASVEMEGRLAEVLSRQRATQSDIEQLKDAYQDIVKGLNAFIEQARR